MSLFQAEGPGVWVEPLVGVLGGVGVGDGALPQSVGPQQNFVL